MSQKVHGETPAVSHARTQSGLMRWVARKLDRLDKTSLLALVDQTVVSGMSLVAAVVVGRACGADGLGIYALAITIIVLFIALHTATVSTPYTVFRTRIKEGDEKYFAGSSLFSSLLVILIGVCVLLATSALFFIFHFIESFEFILLTVAALIPFLIMREFARRYAFAHLRMSTSVLIDGAVAVLQLTGLLLLWMFDVLTPASALMSMGAACAIAAGIWLFRNRAGFVIDSRFLKENLSRKWVLGRWVVLENVLTIFSAYVTVWLLVFLIDSTATGIMAACLVVVNLSSPFLQGMGNSLAPKFAAAASGESTAAIKKIFLRSTLFMTGIMACFVLGCAILGETAMRLLYPGEEYSGCGLIIIVLAVRALCGSANISAHHALLAMEKPLPNLYCSFVGLVATVVAGVWLIPIYGILGGAIAMLLGTILEVIVVYCGYMLVVRNYRRIPKTSNA